MRKIVKVQAHGKNSSYTRIVIPRTIAEKLNLKAGDYVSVELEEDKIIVKKVDLKQLFSTYSCKGKSWPK